MPLNNPTIPVPNVPNDPDYDPDPSSSDFSSSYSSDFSDSGGVKCKKRTIKGRFSRKHTIDPIRNYAILTAKLIQAV